MILISHRGNIDGPNPEKENHPDYINKALEMVSGVEVDVWYTDNTWYLGHDVAQYEVSKDFFYNNNLWFHAKNINALKQLAVLGVHYFWHQNDAVALTSRGYFWTFPGSPLTSKSIAVMPELAVGNNFKNCAGVCSDYPLKWKKQ